MNLGLLSRMAAALVRSQQPGVSDLDLFMRRIPGTMDSPFKAPRASGTEALAFDNNSIDPDAFMQDDLQQILARRRGVVPYPGTF